MALIRKRVALGLRLLLKDKQSLMFVQKSLLCFSSLEFHHPWSPLSLWSLFGTAGSACCLVYSRTYQFKLTVQQLEKALWQSQPSSQYTSARRGQRTFTPGHKCVTTEIRKTFLSAPRSQFSPVVVDVHSISICNVLLRLS